MKGGVKLIKAAKEKRNIARKNRGAPENPLFLKKIYKRYAYVGRRNFITYGYNAARKMQSPAIRSQLKKLWKRLHDEISK